MIALKYTYSRDVFSGSEFKPWIRELFGNDVRFAGFEFGRRFPEIAISWANFEKNKNKIPTKNLFAIRGIPNIIESLVFGARDFSNQLT